MAQQKFIPVPMPTGINPSGVHLSHVNLVVRDYNGETLAAQSTWLETTSGRGTTVISREGIEELFRNMIRDGFIDLGHLLSEEPEEDEEGDLTLGEEPEEDEETAE